MGFASKLLVLASVGLAAVLYLFINDQLVSPADYREFVPEKKWFGPGQRVQEDESIRPFQSDVAEETLKLMKARITLDLERLAPPLEGTAYTYGVNTDHLKSVLKYWRDKYNWRKTEGELNAFQQFKTSIDGIDLHFIHAKPSAEVDKSKKVVPLLLLHGWPSSVLEFTKIIPMLTSGEGHDLAFEVIAPSLPGYGFSSAPAKENFDGLQAARLFGELMTRLGHQTFYCQGGDWGGMTLILLSTIYPDRVKGMHSNMAQVASPGVFLKKYLASKAPGLFGIAKEEEWMLEDLGEQSILTLSESGYLHEQATKPDTIGVSLTTSPAGLAAWILEKYSTATDKDNRQKDDGGLTEKFTLDELLGVVTLYWVTQSGTSAARYYLENIGRRDSNYFAVSALPVHVPMGVIWFPKEPSPLPRSILQNKFKDVVTYTLETDGGHFAAFEKPGALAKDVFKFVKAVEARKREENHKKEL